ncbi:MAG: UDP-N-acetylmuramoyl-L-alanine--D-glutamate ligase [Capsulimonadaceae bacterium]
MSEYTNKQIAVVGAGRSGLACVEVLTRLGASVRLYDDKPELEFLEAAAAARAFGAEVFGGSVPIDCRDLDWVVTSPGVPKSSPLLQLPLAVGIPVIGEIEAAYRVACAPIVAITGTNGKTTTTALVGEMLRQTGHTAWICGNIAAGSLALPLVKAAYQAETEDTIVAEISSFQLEWIRTFRPRVAALLNITPDHGDRQTWDEYVGAKWRIFEHQEAGDLAVINDDLAGDIRARAIRAHTVRYGPTAAEAIVREIVPLEDVALPGRHNVDNLAAAILMARDCGASDDAMAHVGRTFTGVVHRLEYVRTIGGVRFVNNSMCTNADAFSKSLAALPETKVVIAGGVYKGDDPAPLAEAVVRNGVRAVVLIGRSGPDIGAALRAAGFDRVLTADSLEASVAAACAQAQPGDTVLLAPACASFDMFRDFEDRGDQFKQIVQSIGGSGL